MATENCIAYSDEVETIIKSNTRLGADFKGLHSCDLSDSNWSTLGVTFEQVLNKLFEYVSDGKLNLQLTLVSRNRYDSNAGYLKKLIKVQLEERNSVIGKQFASLADTKYKNSALNDVFEFSRYHGHTYSLADGVVREILKDIDVKVNYLVTFNAKDFHDVCAKRQIEILDQ